MTRHSHDEDLSVELHHLLLFELSLDDPSAPSALFFLLPLGSFLPLESLAEVEGHLIEGPSFRKAEAAGGDFSFLGLSYPSPSRVLQASLSSPPLPWQKPCY